MLLFSTWLWARRLTRSEGEALLAVLLLTSVPPVLGHAALATLDVAAAGTVLLALYALQRWLDSARWRDAVFFGVTAGWRWGLSFRRYRFWCWVFWYWPGRSGWCGGAGGRRRPGACGRRARWRGRGGRWCGGVRSCRAEWPGRGGRCCGGARSCRARWRGGGRVAAAERGGPALTVGEARQVDVSVARRRLIGLALIVVMTMVPLAIAYGLRSPGANVVAHKFDWAIVFLQHERGISHDAGVLLQHLWLPTWVKGFFEGIIALKAHNDSGHLSFLLGQQRLTGWWYFYLVALAAKTPIPLLVCGPIGMVGLAHEGWQAKDAWRLAPLVLFLTLLAFASGFSHINIGIRHVFGAIPVHGARRGAFAGAGVGCFAQGGPGAAGSRGSGCAGSVGGLAGAHVVDGASGLSAVFQ